MAPLLSLAYLTLIYVTLVGLCCYSFIKVTVQHVVKCRKYQINYNSSIIFATSAQASYKTTENFPKRAPPEFYFDG